MEHKPRKIGRFAVFSGGFTPFSGVRGSYPVPFPWYLRPSDRVPAWSRSQSAGWPSVQRPFYPVLGRKPAVSERSDPIMERFAVFFEAPRAFTPCFRSGFRLADGPGWMLHCPSRPGSLQGSITLIPLGRGRRQVDRRVGRWSIAHTALLQIDRGGRSVNTPTSSMIYPAIAPRCPPRPVCPLT